MKSVKRRHLLVNFGFLASRYVDDMYCMGQRLPEVPVAIQEEIAMGLVYFGGTNYSDQTAGWPHQMVKIARTSSKKMP